MFRKTFGGAVLHELNQELIPVIVRRQNPSRSLAAFPTHESGLRRRPWHDFMLSPPAPGMILILVAPRMQDQFDLIFGGSVENVARTRQRQTPHRRWPGYLRRSTRSPLLRGSKALPRLPIWFG